MKISKDDITNKEILEAISAFSSHMDSELHVIKSELGAVNSDMGSMKSEIGSIKSEISSMKSEVGSMKSEIASIHTRLTRVESEMVTKDYLDRKLWDLQGDMVAMTRREISRHEERFHAAT